MRDRVIFFNYRQAALDVEEECMLFDQASPMIWKRRHRNRADVSLGRTRATHVQDVIIAAGT
jgi:hypothetical protein